ncbi:hypothetical protein TIFTF001_007973 [Ficus carica]|uniref:Uncharacterized protein n=1 Tax=Ficus carica TaxID=3494 RepID=A0AA88A7N6_FICCA|nr:hypothetical protein TIFTF001_007973 [Ficus carica]
MAKSPNQLLISTLLLATLVMNFPMATLSDQPCQYPCYPPPTGGTVMPTTPSTTTPPSGVYPPPSGLVYPPPSGVYPTPAGGYYPNNNYPPPNGGYYGGVPPPPDPILPYFPFYFKEPLHGSPNDQSTSSPRLQKWFEP